MEWRDTGILLNAKKHGENAMILDVFTPTQGRHMGVLRGGASRKMAPHLQSGAQLDLTWRARLEEHMGSFTCEPQRSRAASAMSNRLALSGLNAVTALVRFCLPEREAFAALYSRTETLLDLLPQIDIWPLAYLQWELALLQDLGFGLDLDACAVTGATEDLRYISPKSGRAVSGRGAGDWADRLLPLPPILIGEGAGTDREIAEALRSTGYFLEHKLARQMGNKPLPKARADLLDILDRL